MAVQPSSVKPVWRPLCFAIAAVLASASASAQLFKPSVLTTKPLRGGAYWISGGSSNTGFIVADHGVIVVDTQISVVDANSALAQIKAVTPNKVDAVIISHGDPDHIGGLSAYPADAAVIEQEETVPYVNAGAAPGAGGGMFGMVFRELAAHPPTRTIGNTESVTVDGVDMVLMHIAPAHTAGDLVIYLPKQKVVYAADILLTSQRLPVIHLGGSSLGWIATMKAMLALDADLYVPGHGPMESKAQLTARLADVEQRRAQIKAMVQSGKSLEEIEQALPEPHAPFLSFAATVYKELTTGYPAPVAPWVNMIGSFDAPKPPPAAPTK